MKKIVLVVLLIMLVCGLTGCKKTECAYCGEMKRCEKYQNVLLGEVDVCNDCIEEIKSMWK